MKTIYIDVYFMINFTVDILAVFLAARMIHIKINMKKLLLSGFLGSVFATAELFLKQKAHDIILAVLFLLALSFIIAKRVSVYRKAKFILAFYIAAFLISGTVNFVYGLLDKYIDEGLNPDLLDYAIFLIDKQDEYIKKLEVLINTLLNLED